MPRVKNIIKRVGETCTIIACYSPVVLYLYGCIVYDYVSSRTDSSLTKWFDICLTSREGYPPTPLVPECMSLHMCMRVMGQLSLFTIRLKNFEIFARLKIPPEKNHRYILCGEQNKCEGILPKSTTTSIAGGWPSNVLLSRGYCRYIGDIWWGWCRSLYVYGHV